jgi:hypothetical protein
MIFGSKISLGLIIAFIEGYRVDIDGRLISPDGEVIKGLINKGGYKVHSFRHGKKLYNLLFHQLKAYELYGNIIFKNDCIRHLNNIKTDNRDCNIAVGSYSDNAMDNPQLMRKNNASNAAIKKYSDELVTEIKELHRAGISRNELMKKYSISSKGTMFYLINVR